MPKQEKSELFKSWLKFEKAEKQAKEKRYEIESEIENLIGLDFEGNSKTFEIDEFKVNLKKNIVYKIDDKAYLSIKNDIPEELDPIEEKISYSLNLKGFEYLKTNAREIYKKISDVVDKKENKTTIKVEKI